jgi:hypothetical protein
METMMSGARDSKVSTRKFCTSVLVAEVKKEMWLSPVMFEYKKEQKRNG